MATLQAFTTKQAESAKLLLAGQVATMMGRKLEEGDWSKVYCQAKDIPDTGWSNLHIDVNYRGLGLEMKLLRIAGLNGKPLKSVCGTTLMHPAATRSIRIDDTNRNANAVMRDVFRQYADLIQQRTERVRAAAHGSAPDMRTGWLIWEDNLAEFLYFEERMAAPIPEDYFAEWNETAARGVRKASKSLWVYEKKTKQKRYSVTTNAGIKIQPYFDVPPPSDPNLYYFRVQSEPVSDDTIRLWVTASTAEAIQARIGSLDRDAVSAAIVKLFNNGRIVQPLRAADDRYAVPILVSKQAFAHLISLEAVSDEHRAQLVLKALSDEE